MLKLLFLLLVLLPTSSAAQNAGSFEIARVQYRGGGDWYNDPSSLSNMIHYLKQHVPISIKEQYKDVALGSANIHTYPFLFLTGHGTITANNAEITNLRTYLEHGGFLYVDDDYGLNKHIRKIMKRVFPDEELIELPFNHPIYSQVFPFQNGLPKIHEHDNKAPQGFGLFHKGKLVMFYTFESNLGDGWSDAEVHNNSPKKRVVALKMGVNILVYALTRI